MSYILGEDRGQAALLPAVIEDYVAADAPVRVSIGDRSTPLVAADEVIK